MCKRILIDYRMKIGFALIISIPKCIWVYILI
jgi:hypothetical protein